MKPRVRLRNDLGSISVWDVVLTALLAAVIAAALKMYVLGAFEIPSSSMERTLLPGDFIIVSKIAFDVRSIEHGDIIVFDPPEAARSVGHQDALIKRVVGLPGDTLRLTTNTVYVNGRPQPNPPLSSTTNLVPDDLLPTKGNNERTVVVQIGRAHV